MKESVETVWKGNMSFESTIDNHKIVVDAKEDVGGQNKGPRPKPLLMTALAGCTGMDVISILKKMRVEVEEFKILIEGDLTEDHPKHFTDMLIIYKFKGKNLPLDKLKKAIDLSLERYCGVSANFRKAMNLSYKIEIID